MDDCGAHFVRIGDESDHIPWVPVEACRRCSPAQFVPDLTRALLLSEEESLRGNHQIDQPIFGVRPGARLPEAIQVAEVTCPAALSGASPFRHE